MALPDYFTHEFGTSIVWGEAGAAGVTNTLSLDALAAGSARMGVEADLGAAWYGLFRVDLFIESGTAPTAGTSVDLYFASSHDGTLYPGGVTGADAAWPGDGNEDEWSKQLEFIMSLIATNDGNVVQQQAPVLWIPKGRYVAPVVDNNMDQAIRDEVTATDNGSRVILTPIRSLVQDSA